MTRKCMFCGKLAVAFINRNDLATNKRLPSVPVCQDHFDKSGRAEKTKKEERAIREVE